MALIIEDDYMDPDVAYLYGLIIARGTFREANETKMLYIDLEFTSLEAEGEQRRIINIREAINIALNRTRDRLSDILGVQPRLIENSYSIGIKVSFPGSTITWRLLRKLTEGKSTYREFTIPEYFYDFDTTILQEFMRGVADGCGFIRPSNQYTDGYHRVYIQIANANWILPIQLCKILQQRLEVPVQVIQWGHPNTREPNRIDVDVNNTSWAREHQIKIFAEDFEKIGFSFAYKREILKELAEKNKSRGHKIRKLCNPLQKRYRREKPPHPCENSPLLPENLKGKHFNSYFEICKALGCDQGIPSPQMTFELAEDED